MASNVAVILIGYLLTVSVTLAWVFKSRQQRVPRTGRTVVGVSLRTLPLFLLLFAVCLTLGVRPGPIFGILAGALGVFLIVGGLPGLGTIGVLYVLQQWILGWPDRSDFLLEPPSHREPGRTSLDELIGKRATAACPLRPGGVIVLDQTEYSARSDLGYIDRGVQVIVVGRKGAYLLVRPAPIQNAPGVPA